MKKMKVLTRQTRQYDLVYEVEVPDDWPDVVSVLHPLDDVQKMDMLWDELLPLASCSEVNVWCHDEELRA